MSSRGKKGSKRQKTPDPTEGVAISVQESSSSTPFVQQTKTFVQTSSSSSVTKGAKASYASVTASSKNGAASMNGSGASSRQSPISPARVQRLHEKEELQVLNDRFANYIERVRNLEAENLSLTVQITNTKETYVQEISGLKSLFETQISDVNRRLVDAEDRNGRLELEAKRWKGEADASTAQLAKSDADATRLRKALGDAEAKIVALTEKLSAATSEGKAAVMECTSLKTRFAELEKQFDAARSKLEESVLQRAALENQMQSLKEELEFKTSVFEVGGAGSPVTRGYKQSAVNIELKLQESLRGLREHYDKKAAELQAELQNMYKSHAKGFSAARQTVPVDTDASADLAKSEMQISDLALQINNLNGKIKMYESKIASMERESAGREAKHNAALVTKDKQITELQGQVSSCMKKYNDLINLHLALEVEVEAYNKLLLSEEERVRIAKPSKVKGDLKKELQMLNDRFAGFIEENLKHLEVEKKELRLQLQNFEDQKQKQMAKMKEGYEVRLTEKQKMVDELSKAKANLSLEIKKLKETNEDLRAKLKNLEAELKMLKGNLKSAEKEISSLSAKLEAALREKQAALDGVAKFKAEISELQLKITSLKKDLDISDQSKLTLEKEMATFKQETNVKSSMYEAELRQQTDLDLVEMDDSVLVEYDARLEKSLQELRQHYDERAAAMKLEMESKYGTKIQELQATLYSVGTESKSVSITASGQSKINELSMKIEELLQKLKTQESRYANLEGVLNAKEVTFLSNLSEKEAEIQNLQAQLSEKMLDFKELMNIKLALDLEISAYDKMLKAEEELFGMKAKESKSKASKSDSLAASYSHTKDLLQLLNNRFASYVDRVQRLRGDSQTLDARILSAEEAAIKEVASVKGIFEAELADARILIDQTSKEKAKLQIEVGKWKAKAEDLAAELAQCQAEIAALKKSAKALEGKVTELSAQLAAESRESQRVKVELSDLRVKYEDLESQLTMAKKQLEEETLIRVDLENRLQSLKEELVFKKSLFDAELNQSRSKLEVSGELSVSEPKESKVHAYLKELRQQNDKQSTALRAELAAIYQTKLGGLQESLAKSPEKASVVDSSSSLKINELGLQVTDLQGKIKLFEARVKQMGQDAASMEEGLRGVIAEKDAKIGELQQEMANQLAEYRELLDIKLALDMEISAYRKLLEGEEERLNTSKTPSPARSTKRKRSMKRSFVEMAVEAEPSLGSAGGKEMKLTAVSSSTPMTSRTRSSRDAAISFSPVTSTVYRSSATTSAAASSSTSSTGQTTIVTRTIVEETPLEAGSERAKSCVVM